MKKFLPVIIILVLALGVGGYFLSQSKNSSTSTNPTAQQNAGNKNVFNSIQDALSQSLSLKCDYTDKEENHTLAYIKAGAIRADVTNKQAATTNDFIMKDKKMYFWDVATKKGMMMTVPEVTPIPQPSTTMKENSSPENESANVMGSLEKFKEHCQAAVVDDSLFTPPTDVTFTDFSKMMQAPTGSTTGGAMSQEQIQQMMKQYAQPTSSENQ